MSVIFSVGKWGGFYVANTSWSFRLCLGFVAFTLIYSDIDDVFADYLFYKRSSDLLESQNKGDR